MKKILLFISTVFCLVACGDPYDGNISPVTDDRAITDYLNERPEQYSLWIDLLKYTDFYNSMNLNLFGEETYTAFVPTNEALTKYLAEGSYATVSDIQLDVAKNLVKYHTIVGNAYSFSEFPTGVLPDTTASGDYLSIEFLTEGESETFVVMVNSLARITQLDGKALNGVVHAIDQVLTPITQTVWDRLLENREEYSIMIEALERTSLHNSLSLVSTTDGGYEQRLYFTFFAVSNATFEKEDIHSVDDLIQKLGSEEAFYNYLHYHVISQQMDYSSLSQFTGDAQSKNISPALSGELINVSMVESKLLLNYNRTTRIGIGFLRTNISARNGVLHEVDNWMPVTTPDRVTVVWELTDYPVLAGTISDYRKANLSNDRSISLSQTDFYRYQTYPANNFGLVYRVYNKNTLPAYNMMNYDGLEIRPGLLGWVEIDSPTIIRGRYMLNICYYSPASAVQNGKVMFSIDGTAIGTETALNGRSTIASEIVVRNIGTVNFTTTSSHVLRILSTDGNPVVIDYVEFIPN